MLTDLILGVNVKIQKKKKNQRHRILGNQTPDIGLGEMFMENTYPHLLQTSC